MPKRTRKPRRWRLTRRGEYLVVASSTITTSLLVSTLFNLLAASS